MVLLIKIDVTFLFLVDVQLNHEIHDNLCSTNDDCIFVKMTLTLIDF